MIKHCNGLLKQGLWAAAATPMLGRWVKHLCSVLRTLHERSWNGGQVPVEALLHQTATPVQLQIETKDDLLKPDMGKQGNILLPAPQSLE